MRHITLPFTEEVKKELRIHETVLLSGTILVGRDQVHRRFVDSIGKGEALPLDLKDQIIYYMGPARRKDGDIIGSCGPTTSARMDPFTPTILDQGIAAVIGKGPRSRETTDSFASHGALYLCAFGGCGALYADTVLSVRTLAYEDLGPEALLELTVSDFPAIVAIDSLGNTIF